MLDCLYGTCRYSSSGGDPGKPGRFCEGHTRRLAGVEDCGASTNRRRPEARMDGSRFGLDAHELKSLDPGGKCGWIVRPEEQADSGAASAADATDRPGSGAAIRPVASGIWPKPSSLGRAHARRALKAALRIEDASKTGPEMDASIGLSVKTSQLCVSSGPGRRGEGVPPRVKKNSKTWALGRPLSSKMRPGLACIPGWAWDGPKEANLIGSRRQVSINTGSMFPVGWHLSWGGMG